METFLNYFETIPSSHRSLILVGGLTFFWVLEGAVPLFKFNYKKWQHAIP
ncbi:MAG TPA: sterol desaturase, partial [Mariniflexile sp.]|nr:sterol desaturase [Mariniflexile sp.]